MNPTLKSIKQHNWKHLKLHYEHYSDIDFLYWEKRARHAVDRIRKLKREKSKHHYYLELYTDYMQIFEATMINMLAITRGKLFEYLFIDTGYLKEHAKSLAKGTANNDDGWADSWIRDFVFQRLIFGGYIMEDPEIKIGDYKMVLRESAQDYLKDCQLLNAFKHGFRVKLFGKSSLAISLNGSKRYRPPNPYTVGEFNAGIIYYSKERPEGVPANTIAVFKNRVSFNWERIYQQILCLSSALENTRQTILMVARPEGGAKTTCNTLKIIDRKTFYKFRGVARFKNPIGSFTTKQNGASANEG